MLENEKIWILQNILSNVEEHNSAKLLRESLFKVIDGLTPLITASGAGVYTGIITPASTVPVEGDKVFLVTIPGTYSNFGNVVLPENNFGFIFKNGSSFSLQSVEMPTLSAEGKVEEGNTEAVSGGEVYNYIDNLNNAKKIMSIKPANTNDHFLVKLKVKTTGLSKVKSSVNITPSITALNINGKPGGQTCVYINTNHQPTYKTHHIYGGFNEFETGGLDELLITIWVEPKLIGLENYSFLFNNLTLTDENKNILDYSVSFENANVEYLDSVNSALFSNIKATSLSTTTFVCLYNSNIFKDSVNEVDVFFRTSKTDFSKRVYFGLGNDFFIQSAGSYDLAPNLGGYTFHSKKIDTSLNKSGRIYLELAIDKNEILDFNLLEAYFFINRVRYDLDSFLYTSDKYTAGLDKYPVNITNIQPLDNHVSPIFPLKIPTHESGKNQMTHPSVVFFENGFNGDLSKKYVMAHTPLPNYEEKEENPTITASPNKIDWTQQGSEPIDFPTNDIDYFLSDPCLVYNESTGLLECWYRENRRSTEQTTLIRKTSSDLINWSARQNIRTFDWGVLGYEPKSFSVLIIEGVYKLYDATGRIWSFNGTTINQVGTFSPISWHIDVQYLSGKYYLMLCPARGEDYKIFESTDGVNFMYLNTVSNRYKLGGFTSSFLYKGCIFYDGVWNVVTSGVSGGLYGTWKLGLSVQNNYNEYFNDFQNAVIPE